jgi:hypothetical protein
MESEVLARVALHRHFRGSRGATARGDGGGARRELAKEAELPVVFDFVIVEQLVGRQDREQWHERCKEEARREPVVDGGALDAVVRAILAWGDVKRRRGGEGSE